MLEWIQNNISNLMVFSSVAVLIGFALRRTVIDYRRSCHGNCSGCGMSGLCQPDKNGQNGLVSAYRQANPKQN